MPDTILLVKQSASHLKKYVSDNFSIKLKSGHAQQLVAAAFEFKSYQSLITTKELSLYSTSARNLPTIKNLPKATERIIKRILSIPEINEKLLTVSDELAEEVLIGVLPICFACGSCEDLRWPFTIIEDVHWCCNKCTKLGHMENSIDLLLTEMYTKVKETSSSMNKSTDHPGLSVSRLLKIHKINFMPNEVEFALEGDHTKWDVIISKINQRVIDRERTSS